MPDIREAGFNVSTTNVTLTTTTEAVVISSTPVPLPSARHQVVIFAWSQLTTGAGTTAVTPRIRRGTTVSGTVVGDEIAEEVKAAAGSNEPHFIMASEERSGEATVEYSLTLDQTGATGNGTVLQAGIIVLVL